MVIEVVASVLCDIVGYENSSKEWDWASCFVGKLSILARLFYPSLQLPKALATLALLFCWAVLSLLVSCCSQRCVLVVFYLVSCLVMVLVDSLSCVLFCVGLG